MFRRRRARSEPDDADAADLGDITDAADDADDADEAGDADDAGDADAGASAGDEPDEPTKPERPNGPWDLTEIDLDNEPDSEVQTTRIDLGAILVRGRAGMQARIEVDQQASRVRAVTFIEGRSGVQLQAFAAPRSSGIWRGVAEEIAADATRRGGTATPVEGEWGTELRVVVPATLPDGSKGSQATRVVGVDGPRWLLRATYFGPAVDAAQAGQLADVVRDTVVVRGGDPMAPRELLPMRMPPTATRTDDPDGSEDGDDGDPSDAGDE